MSDSLATAESPAPTRVRYVVVGLATLMAVLLYLDRFCLSFVERYIKEDLSLTNREMAWLLGAFFLAYAAAQVPAGWLSDRFGGRLMLGLYILLWSVFTGAIGLAFSFWAIFVLRFGVGMAQAGAYPTSGSLLSKWVPFVERALSSAIVSTGGRIGGFIAPVLTAYLLLAFVPRDAPSHFETGDILNAPSLARRLLDGDESAKGAVSAAVSEICVTHLGSEYLPRLAAEESSQTADAELVVTLNEALGQPNLIDRVNIDELALPDEARRLARIPADQLSTEQIERRNRLLVEVAYPEEIRKLYRLGWRPVMLVYGLAGLLVAGLFWLLVRDEPAHHPVCNPAERALIEAGRPASSTTARGRAGALPVGCILRSRSLWLSSLSQFGTNFGWVFLLTWLPRFLADVHHVPIKERGWMASIPILLGMVGMLGGGWLCDALTRQLGPRWGRCLPMSLTRFVAMAAFLACTGIDDPWLITAAFCVVAIFTDLGTSSVWAFMQDTGGRYVGSVLGWGNMWGNFGAALSPIALNWIVENHGWDQAFLACAAAFFVSGIAALGVDATIPIVPEEEATASGAA